MVPRNNDFPQKEYNGVCFFFLTFLAHSIKELAQYIKQPKNDFEARAATLKYFLDDRPQFRFGD